MSYQPPPEQPGGPPSGSSPGGSSSEGTPTTNIPSGGGQGGYAPPPSGGYSPPASGGTPTTNIPPQGEQPGYTPPPSGGYTPPPAGGYTPPPPGGYTPPPPGGGYGAPPPPPPPTGGGMGSMGGAGGVDIQDLMQGYMGAVTTPNTAFYESQIPKANMMKILIGLGIVIAVNVIVGLIGAGAAAAQMGPLRDQFRAQGIDFDPGAFAGGGGIAGALFSIVLTPLFFFIGAWIIYTVAKMLGGQGADFMTHAYLLSLSYVPLGVIASVLGLIPGIGGLVGLVALVYRQYSQGKSLEASQRMAPGRAQAAAFIPLGIAVLFFCLCFLLLVFGLMAAFSGANR
ncbi:MAG: YIP1 family protein [Chloroflexota bacterium]|nr:YIP1 family protein [Chloroflexota bacterium]